MEIKSSKSKKVKFSTFSQFYLPSSNLPAPINVSSTEQTKVGNLIIEGNLTTAGFKMTTGAGADKVLTTDASGVASWNTPAGGSLWTQTGDDIYYNTGNVGIGTTTPGSDVAWAVPALDISGSRGTAIIRTTGAAGIATLRMTGPGASSVDDWHINMGAGANSVLVFNALAGGGVGANILVLKNNGNVGIGTINPNTKLEVAGSLTITGSSSYIKLPLLTTTQRDVLSPESGMMIFNSTANEVQVYVPSEWKKFGAGAAVGTACSVPGECATALCVDNYCCDATCSGTVCQTCGLLSSNGVGHCGYVNNSSNDPRNTCATASVPSADSCKSPNCSGTGYACGYLIGDGGQPVCKYCSGSSYDPINIAIGVQDTTTPSVCTATHYRCDGSGNCTAPTHDVCVNTPGGDAVCTNICIAPTYAGCSTTVSAAWDNAGCSGSSSNCTYDGGMTVGACMCKAYDY